jgi:hypothetical protein
MRRYTRQQNQQALRQRAGIANDVEHLRNTYPPSLFAYSVVFIVALVLDILDVFAPIADATLVGFAVVVVINIIFFLVLRAFLNKSIRQQQLLATLLISAGFVFFIPIVGQLLAATILLIIVGLGARNKSGVVMDASRNNIVQDLKRIEQTLESFRAQLAGVVRATRKVPGLRGVTRKAMKTAKPLTQASKTSLRMIRNTIGNIVPIIGIFFLQIWTVVATYRDQKAIHRESQELLQEYERNTAQEQISRIQHQRQLAFVVLTEQERAQSFSLTRQNLASAT